MRVSGHILEAKPEAAVKLAHDEDEAMPSSSRTAVANTKTWLNLCTSYTDRDAEDNAEVYVHNLRNAFDIHSSKTGCRFQWYMKLFTKVLPSVMYIHYSIRSIIVIHAAICL